MIRLVVLVVCLALLSACGGDGRGSIYSSQRAKVAQPVYVPVTPSATPVLTEPVAITPGAVPVTPLPAPVPIETASVIAPAASLKPIARGTGPRPVATPVAAARVTPAAVLPLRVAKGPIYSACRKAGRKAATPARCGCIQAVADRELTGAQQRRGAGYFDSPQKLQDARQSDSSANEAFWTAWKAFGQAAAQQCRAT